MYAHDSITLSNLISCKKTNKVQSTSSKNISYTQVMIGVAAQDEIPITIKHDYADTM